MLDVWLYICNFLCTWQMVEICLSIKYIIDILRIDGFICLTKVWLIAKSFGVDQLSVYYVGNNECGC